MLYGDECKNDVYKTRNILHVCKYTQYTNVKAIVFIMLIGESGPMFVSVLHTIFIFATFWFFEIISIKKE